MGKIIDLHEYQIGTPYNGMPWDAYLKVLRKDNNRPVAIVYSTLELAIVDIAYARLSALLKLPCVVSEWGMNFPPEPRNLVSVAFLGKTWKPFSLWSKKHTNPVANENELKQFVLLNMLLGNFLWKEDYAGFVDKENNFIKAFNTYVMSGMWLMIARGDIDEMPIGEISVSRILSYIDNPYMQDVLPKFGALSNEQLISCAAMPEHPKKKIYQEYVFERLRNGRELAKKCFDALCEQEDEKRYH